MHPVIGLKAKARGLGSSLSRTLGSAQTNRGFSSEFAHLHVSLQIRLQLKITGCLPKWRILVHKNLWYLELT